MIQVNLKYYNLGKYVKEVDAAMAYDSAALFYFGDKACINFADSTPKSAEMLVEESRKMKRQARVSGYFGVAKATSGRYTAYVGGPKTHTYLGTFDTAEEAAKVRDAEAKARYGEKAKLNFPTSTVGIPTMV